MLRRLTKGSAIITAPATPASATAWETAAAAQPSALLLSRLSNEALFSRLNPPRMPALWLRGSGGPGDALPITELEAMTRLHGMASRFVRDGNLTALLAEAVDTAVAVVGADAGLIVTLAESGDAPQLAAQRGCERFLLDASASARLGRALREAHRARDQRIIVEDLGAAAELDTPLAALLRASEIRALQSLPLRSPSGELVGLLSTYHRRPWRARGAELSLLDLLGRQCTDAIERAPAIRRAPCRTPSCRRTSCARPEELFRTTVENMPDNLILYDRDYRIVYSTPRWRASASGCAGGRPASCSGTPGGEVWPDNVWNPLRTHSRAAIATRRAPDLRDRAGLSTSGAHLAPVDRRPARRHRRRDPADPGDEPRRHRPAPAGRRAARGRRAQERLHRHALARAAQPAGGDPHQPLRPRARPARQRRDGERATKVIDRQIGHLVGMVDDLLDVTRITQNKIELRRERLDLNALVRETVEDNRPHLELGGVSFEVRLAGSPARGRRRRRADRAGGDQPAHQRRQVHRRRRELPDVARRRRGRHAPS